MEKNRYSIVKSLKKRELTLFCGSLLLFLIICISGGTSIKLVTLFVSLLALITGMIGFPTIRNSFRLPFLPLFALVAFNGMSIAYAVAPKFALNEFLKYILALCVCIVLVFLASRHKTDPSRVISSIFEYCAAFMGLVSIDLLSTRIFSGIVIAFLNIFTSNYANLSGVEPGTRMTSLLTNPNAFAACMGIGVLLSLNLVLSSTNEKEKNRHLICLFVNSLSFVLAFSMGATAFIAVAFLVYLFSEKEMRSSLFVLMVETLLSVVACASIIATTSFSEWDGFDPIPMLCVLLGSVLLCVMNRYLGRSVSVMLSAHSKALTITIAVTLSFAMAFVLFACNLTDSVALKTNETLSRAVYPAPGNYTMSYEGTGQANVTIQSQNKYETMMHTYTTLYQGSLDAAAFVVPEDSLVVYVNFSALEEVRLDQVVCEGSDYLEVPLDYPLLPSFIANRLQGLWANQNAIQRTVFFEDGIKIFKRHPFGGSGLGSFENGIKSVQSFYYETKYAHNHYIQLLTETGVIGLFLFLTLLAVSGLSLILELRKKAQAHPMTPVLLSALVFMAGHAFVEVDFSFYGFIPFALGVFTLINITCGSNITPKWFAEKTKTYILAANGALILVFSCLLIANISAGALVEDNPTFNSLERAASMDVFERNDYMLSYVCGALSVPDNANIQNKAREYAKILEKCHSNSIPYYLADYYFSIGEQQSGFEMIEKYVTYVASDQQAWDKAFLVLIQNVEVSESYCQGLKHIVQIMEDWNENNLGQITLNEQVVQLLIYLDIM